ncbi:metal ABC transporter solute-binding protein, Zn/Mn family [Arhodomonas sp. SL1]|uniref:metal ABC transporter solute-binding protein, Zn/Mn family n=1 Tax=Arhodomonas sp. SL1 TaxID=3425691 RepID=UPI003F8808C0
MSRQWLHRAVFVLSAVFAAPLTAAPPLVVYTSVLPVKTFVKAVGGERVEITSLVRQGESPATFDPSPRRLAAMVDAQLFFRVGVPFERSWMPRLTANASEMAVVDLREVVALRAIDAHGHEGDGHGHDHEEHEEVGDHAGGGVDPEGADPHIWTSPRNVVALVERIRAALSAADPEGAEAYRANAVAYTERLQALDGRIAERLAPYEGRSFAVFHPSWGYFADRYGLTQRAIEVEGKEPGPAGLSDLIGELREMGVRVVFVQDQFSQRSAQTVAEAIGGAVVGIDPLAEDYIDNMERVSRRMAEALE